MPKLRGWGSLILSNLRRLGHFFFFFFLGGVKTLNFNILECYRKMNILGL